MSVLDGFTLCTGFNNTRPGWGTPRITISKTKITYSKNLVTEMGSPQRVNLYRKDNLIAITPTNRGEKKIYRNFEKNLVLLCKAAVLNELRG